MEKSEFDMKKLEKIETQNLIRKFFEKSKFDEKKNEKNRHRI